MTHSFGEGSLINMGFISSFLGEISSDPLELIRRELSVLEPWKVALSILLVVVVGIFLHKSNQ